MDASVLKSFLPEIFFSISIFLQLVFNARLINRLEFNFPIIDKEIFVQTLFILGCLFFLYWNLKIEGFFSSFLFLNDSGSRYVKLIMIVSSMLALSTIWKAYQLQNLNFFEYFIILLLSFFSLLLLVNVYDLVSAYLIIEMQALAFYILASYQRGSAFSTEAGLKYFVSGSFISGIYLFGCSLIYGSLGTLNFTHLSVLLSIPFDDKFAFIEGFALVGIFFVTITLLFKVSAAPFHFWSPDVYEGSPLSSTIAFSILPKIALFTFLIRWVSVISGLFSSVQILLLASGLFSVFLGTFFAIKQRRVKKLVIYSSIAQVGFLVIALATNSLEGFISIYYFLVIYIITSVLVWSNIVYLYNSQKINNRIYSKPLSSLFLSNLANLFKSDKLWALSFVIIFFSVAGIPPLSGFLAKVFVLLSLVFSGYKIAAVILVLISAISVFYYVRVIKVVFFEPEGVKTQNQRFHTLFNKDFFDLDCMIMGVCLFSLIFFFFYPSLLILTSQNIVLGLFNV